MTLESLAAAALLVVLFYLFIRPVYFAYFFVRPARQRPRHYSPAGWGYAYDRITLTSQDRTPLSGWYVPGQNGAAVVLLHPLGSNRLSVSFQAVTLLDAGFGVLMFDLRRHGDSSGRVFARTQAAVDDVLTAVAFLSRRPEVQPGKIGVYGLSIGGLLAIQAAAQTIAIRAVAVDGPSPAVLSDIPAPQTLWQKYYTWPEQRYYMKAIDLFAQSPPLPSNLAVLKRMRKRPFLFISAGKGEEKRMVKQFYDAAPDPKEHWEIPEARHATGWVVAPEAYRDHLATFFTQHLAPENNAAPDQHSQNSS